MAKKEMNLDELDQVSGGVIGHRDTAEKFQVGQRIIGMRNGARVEYVVRGLTSTADGLAYRVDVHTIDQNGRDSGNACQVIMTASDIKGIN